MEDHVLPVEAERALAAIQQSDIVIGIPSFNNARTIQHVVKACYAGLSKYFPQLKGVVINSDGGSTDGTRDAVLSAKVDEHSLMLLSTPLYPLHRLSFPYHGIPGKGSAFRMVFEMARRLGAGACAVVDSDLRSITPEWIDLLLRPILFAKYDFVAFERLKPYLISLWRGGRPQYTNTGKAATPEPDSGGKNTLEVRNV